MQTIIILYNPGQRLAQDGRNKIFGLLKIVLLRYYGNPFFSLMLDP